MVSHDRLVTLWLGRGVDSSARNGFSERRFTEAPLDAIIHRKVYCPCGEIAEDGWTEASIHASNTIVSYSGLDDI